jgi:hypothetical protein
MNAMAEPLFTQNYCTLVPYQAGGALIAGRKQGCSVIVKDGDLILFTDQGEVDRAPLASVKIDTPAVQRKLGASTFVQMNDHRWTIDFGLAGRLDRPPKRGPIAAMKFARARNQEFTDLLRLGGATSSSSPNSSSTWAGSGTAPGPGPAAWPPAGRSRPGPRWPAGGG